MHSKHLQNTNYICRLFEFITFAIDEDLDTNGWGCPRIGGSVYDKLNVDPRLYYPEILDSKQ